MPWIVTARAFRGCSRLWARRFGAASGDCRRNCQALPNLRHDRSIASARTRGVRGSSGAHAASVVLVQNHPSGDPTPSPEDYEITQQLVTCGVVLDIPVQDHVIVGLGRYVSVVEQEILVQP